MKRFILEIVFDESYYERISDNRKVFRYRTRKEFVGFRAKSNKNAKSVAKARVKKLIVK